MSSRIPSILAAMLLTTGTLAVAAGTPANEPVTPMTPDIVPSFDAFDLEHADYVKRVEMVPMRDGVKLYTVILFHKGAANAPILLSRTPYDAKGATQRNISPVLTEALPVMDAEFVSDGYIRVYQDIRGMHNSEGDFVMTRPIIGPLNHTTIDESTDAYQPASKATRDGAHRSNVVSVAHRSDSLPVHGCATIIIAQPAGAAL